MDIYQKGIYRFPAIFENTILFCSDDDIWKIDLQSPQLQATRLTGQVGSSWRPFISPDGTMVAYLGEESGRPDIYVMNINGGAGNRITFEGDPLLFGWANDRTLLLGSSLNQPFLSHTELYQVDIYTKEWYHVAIGPVSAVCIGPKNKKVIGRNTGDPAKWKRYRGGTAGKLWVQHRPNGEYNQILTDLNTNIANPYWYQDRIYFLSDHLGTANIFSCDEWGHNIEQLTFHEEFYARHLYGYEDQLIYSKGGDLYYLKLGNKSSIKIDFMFTTTGLQKRPRFENVFEYMEDFSINENATDLAIITRGRPYAITPWKDACYDLGDMNHEYRYKLPIWIEKSLLMVAEGPDHGDNYREKLLFWKDVQKSPVEIFTKQNWGKIWSMFAAPDQKLQLVALSNNRNEMFLLNLKTQKVILVEKNEYHRIQQVNWSPCSRYMAYSAAIDQRRMGIKIYDTKKTKSALNPRLIINPVLEDTQPVFSMDGLYLFFIGVREFYPHYQGTHFDLGFPFAGRPYAISLQRTTPPIYQSHLKYNGKNNRGLDGEGDMDGEADNGPPSNHPHARSSNGHKKKSKKIGSSKKLAEHQPNQRKKKNDDLKYIQIDFEDLEQSIHPIPIDIGGHAILAVSRNKLFILKREIAAYNHYNDYNDEDFEYSLYQYCFNEGKIELFYPDIRGLDSTPDGSKLVLWTKLGPKIVSTDMLPIKSEHCDPKTGNVDLSIIKLSIDPQKEWTQMFKEAWYLQKEHFWREDMAKVNWKKVYNRYFPMLARLNTRGELSDLIWEMQGELGTSHCYEYFGDYHRVPNYHPVGHLGAKTHYDPKKKGFIIDKIFQGDSWIPQHSSPLCVPGVSLKAGDIIVGINGQRLSETQDCYVSLAKSLEFKAHQNVNISVKRQGKKTAQEVMIHTLGTQNDLIYREWVENNRAYVHKVSKNTIGYLHIPDMDIRGYGEFYRYFLAELVYPGLIVDVRHNAGGHISQHLLKVLAQKVIGHDQSRWNGKYTYPTYAVPENMVCLCNEHTGSDGDIFAHSFKLMKLGPLVGKRTWGGVVGMNSQYFLKDGTVVTQPEFSFYFHDVGHGVENYGTDPDFDVEITPMDYKKNIDPQLDKAIELAMKK